MWPFHVSFHFHFFFLVLNCCCLFFSISDILVECVLTRALVLHLFFLCRLPKCSYTHIFRSSGWIDNFKLTGIFCSNWLHVFVFAFSGTNSGVHNDSSCSSGPDSPHTSKDLHLDGSGTPTRAQYLSASCVVFTHYSGDTATVVDEHFSRALNFSNKDSKGKLKIFLFFIFGTYFCYAICCSYICYFVWKIKKKKKQLRT